MLLLALVPLAAGQAAAPKIARDPGVREGMAAGSAIAGLTPAQQSFFSTGLMQFRELVSVTGSVRNPGKALAPHSMRNLAPIATRNLQLAEVVPR